MARTETFWNKVLEGYCLILSTGVLTFLKWGFKYNQFRFFNLFIYSTHKEKKNTINKKFIIQQYKPIYKQLV